MKKYLLLASVFLLLGLIFFSVNSSKELRIYFFDIGQGDGMLITTPQGAAILIDGGPNSKILSKLGEVLSFFKKNIDLAILTHPHADHLTGSLAVFERYKINRVLATGVLHTIDEYREWLKIINDKHIPWQQAQLGQTISFSDGVSLQVLWPNRDLAGQEVKDLNSTSVVVRLVYGDTKALFMGDAGTEQELAIVDSSPDISAQLLKVGHQGSNTSSDPSFIKAVNPTWAVITVGVGNRYGHPHGEVLARFKNLGINILRTDQLGTIMFTSDGKRWQREK